MNAESTRSCPMSVIPIREERFTDAARCRQCANQAARLDFFVTLGETVFSMLMGLMTGSAGLHAMALLTGGDILSKGVNWMAILASHKAPTPRFPYGYGRLQFLSALFIGVLLFCGAIFFFLHNMQDIQSGKLQRAGGVAVFSAILLATSSWLMYRIMSCTADHNNNPAIRAAAMDNRVDSWSSIMVLIGAVLTHFDFLTADRIMALVVALLVMKLGGEIVRDAVHSLLDMGLPPDIQAQVRALCEADARISGVKRLRGRRMGGSYEIDMELCLPGECSIREAQEIKTALRREIAGKVRHVESIQMAFSPDSPSPGG
ncbi:MAG: cation transporter [Magnetococcales bacterium]|nr:cation transporter [Magnetococcales bacterium]